MQAEVKNDKKQTVLIVDDDRDIRQVLACNLRSEDIRVVQAANGLEGLEVLAEGGVDAILLDVRLPDFNGWGILSLVKLTDALHAIPVIMVTVEPPDAALVRQFPPDSYIGKPFDIRHVIAQVKLALNSRSTARSTERTEKAKEGA